MKPKTMQMYQGYTGNLSRAHKWKWWEIAGIALVAYIIFVPGAMGSISGFFSGFSTIGQSTPSVSGGSQPGKIALQVNDPLAATGNNAPTATVIARGTVQISGVTYSAGQSIESPTISSSGAGTTSNFYPAGALLTVKLVLSTYETIFYNIVAPGATASQVQGGQWPTITLLEPKLPTVSISMTDGSGNTFASSGNDINFSNSGHCTSGNNCLGVSSTVLTVTVTNTVANTGYIESYDPVNGVQNCMAAVFNEGTSGNPNEATYSGMPWSMNKGSTVYEGTYISGGFSALPAGAGFQPITSACGSTNISTGGLSEQTKGTSTYGGSVTFKFTVGVGGLVHGNTIADSLKLWEYSDFGYASSNSAVMGPAAVQLGSTFTFTLAA